MLSEASFAWEGWQQLGSPSPRGAPASVGVERLGTSFVAGDREVAVNDVYRFFDEGAADRAFDDLSETWFRIHPYETTWTVPVEITITPAADTYRLACNEDNSLEVHQCRFIGQYDVFVADLSVRTIVPDYSGFANLVAEIDARFDMCGSDEAYQERSQAHSSPYWRRTYFQR